jgi:hypothetical protein
MSGWSLIVGPPQSPESASKHSPTLWGYFHIKGKVAKYYGYIDFDNWP